jgi:hypothetical protein
MSRTHKIIRNYRDFSSGFMLGLTLLGVALGTIGAARRFSQRRLALHEREIERASIPRIDGARPLDPVLRAARPQEMDAPRLANEVSDYSPTSQRW